MNGEDQILRIHVFNHGRDRVGLRLGVRQITPQPDRVGTAAGLVGAVFRYRQVRRSAPAGLAASVIAATIQTVRRLRFHFLFRVGISSKTLLESLISFELK